MPFRRSYGRSTQGDFHGASSSQRTRRRHPVRTPGASHTASSTARGEARAVLRPSTERPAPEPAPPVLAEDHDVVLDQAARQRRRHRAVALLDHRHQPLQVRSASALAAQAVLHDDVGVRVRRLLGALAAHAGSRTAPGSAAASRGSGRPSPTCRRPAPAAGAASARSRRHRRPSRRARRSGGGRRRPPSASNRVPPTQDRLASVTGPAI